jgi:hypothetical protein
MKMIWRLCGDADAQGGIRLTKCGTDHFDKTPNNRMRFFLAIQALSESMVKAGDEFLKGTPEAEIFSVFRELVLAIDRFVDIMNARWMNGAKMKGCEPINAPDHRHINELLGIASVLYLWEQEPRENDKQFIPATTYEDLLVCCLGTVGCVWTYVGNREVSTTVNEDNREVYATVSCSARSWHFDQKRLGTDKNEHHHGNIRTRNPNPSFLECQYYSAKSETVNSNNFTFAPKTNTGGQRGGFASELLAPVYKKPTKRK